MATVAQPQVTKSIKVDANLAPILDTMLKKAGIKLDDVSDTFIRIWINQNLDLLNEDDRKKFNLKN